MIYVWSRYSKHNLYCTGDCISSAILATANYLQIILLEHNSTISTVLKNRVSPKAELILFFKTSHLQGHRLINLKEQDTFRDCPIAALFTSQAKQYKQKNYIMDLIVLTQEKTPVFKVVKHDNF